MCLMIFILFICVILCWIVALAINKYDIMAPASLICIGYLVSIVCAILNIESWGIDLSDKTVVILLIGILSALAGNILVILLDQTSHSTLSNNNYSTKHQLKMITNDSTTDMLFLTFILVVFVLYWRDIMRVSGGGDTITTIIKNFRYSTYNSTALEDNLNIVVNQLQKFISGYAFIYTLIYLNNYFVEGKIVLRKTVTIFISVGIFAVSTILSGGRLQLIVFAVAVVNIIFVLRCWQKGKWVSFGLKDIVKIIIIAFVAIVIFYYLKNILGRDSQEVIFSYITRYIGGSIELFDLFVKSPERASTMWGSETFSGFYGMFSKFGYDMDIIKGLEWRVSPNGYSLGNVYTAIRRYYSDFGICGVFLCEMIESCIFTAAYLKLKRALRSDKKPYFLLLIYSVSLYAVVLDCIEGYFYITLCSVGNVIKIIIMYVCYLVLTNIDTDIIHGRLVYHRNRH